MCSLPRELITLVNWMTPYKKPQRSVDIVQNPKGKYHIDLDFMKVKYHLQNCNNTEKYIYIFYFTYTFHSRSHVDTVFTILYIFHTIVNI